MSNQQVRLATLIIEESFGDVVAQVSSHLLKHGDSPLLELFRTLQLRPTQIRKSLCILIQHQLCECAPHKSGYLLYRLNLKAVLLRTRFPRYIYAAKTIFGDAGELIVEDLLRNGQSLFSQCIQRVGERFETAAVKAPDIGDIVKKQFLALVEGHYLQRVTLPPSELNGSETTPSAPSHCERFLLPPIEEINFVSRKRQLSEEGGENGGPQAKRKRVIDEEEESRAKRRKVGELDQKEAMPADAGIFWHINYDRFHQHFRNEAIASMAAEKVDETAACVMRAVLTISQNQMQLVTDCAVGAEVYALQIGDRLGSKPKLSSKELDQYLRVLIDDQVQFLRKVGDNGGGSYAVNFKHLSGVLCQSSIESVVRERFGSKCLRLFRLLLLKKTLEQKQVADMAMIPSKEAKELLYSLVAENYVSLQEIPKAGDYAPSRTFYLFSVNLLQITRLLLERCYQGLGNLMQRRASEVKKNKRLLQKFQEYEAQLLGGQLPENSDEPLTPAEKEAVQIVKQVISKLELAELQMDETIFHLSNYIELHSTATPVAR